MDPRDENLPETTAVDLDPPFVDDRGEIQNIVHHMIGSAVLITSNAGAVRGNHYHTTDYHYCYIVKGQIEYLERPHGSSEAPTGYLFGEGDLFFTPPLVEHAMRFPVDTVFLTLARNSRFHDSYEEDVIRVDDMFGEGEEEAVPRVSGPNSLRRRDNCRLCGSQRVAPVMELAATPPANAFVETPTYQRVYPLELYLCTDCGHVQLLDIVSPEELFTHYVYASGTSQSFVDHFERYAKEVIENARLKEGDLVVEIGSNDGTHLRFFQDAGMRVIGVDPAVEISQAANASGIPTLAEFFTSDTADRIRREHGLAKVVIANNVFAHADDLGEIARATESLLDEEGTFWFEVQYLLEMVRDGLFDMIYHEHLSYHAVQPLLGFLESNGLTMTDVKQVPTHGGSIRCTAARTGDPASEKRQSASIDELLAAERDARLTDPQTYADFKSRIDTAGLVLRNVLAGIRKSGKTVVGYGAPAKATTLMYQFGLGSETLEFIADDSELKQGLYTPGLHIPVVSPDRIYDSPPDFILILAWNFADSIIEKHSRIRELGSRFIVPYPDLRIT